MSIQSNREDVARSIDTRQLAGATRIAQAFYIALEEERSRSKVLLHRIEALQSAVDKSNIKIEDLVGELASKEAECKQTMLGNEQLKRDVDQLTLRVTGERPKDANAGTSLERLLEFGAPSEVVGNAVQFGLTGLLVAIVALAYSVLVPNGTWVDGGAWWMSIAVVFALLASVYSGFAFFRKPSSRDNHWDIDLLAIGKFHCCIVALTIIAIVLLSVPVAAADALQPAAANDAAVEGAGTPQLTIRAAATQYVKGVLELWWERMSPRNTGLMLLSSTTVMLLLVRLKRSPVPPEPSNYKSLRPGEYMLGLVCSLTAAAIIACILATVWSQSADAVSLLLSMAALALFGYFRSIERQKGMA